MDADEIRAANAEKLERLRDVAAQLEEFGSMDDLPEGISGALLLHARSINSLMQVATITDSAVLDIAVRLERIEAKLG